MPKRALHLVEIPRRHHLVDLIGQSYFVCVRDRHRIGLAAFMRDNRPVMSVFDFDFPPIDRVRFLHSDLLLADLNVAPLTVVAILAGIRRVELLFVDVGGVWSAGGHRNRAVAAVAEARERNTEYRHSGYVVIPGIDSDLIEPELAVPAQMRIDHRDRRIHRGAAGSDQHFVRASISGRIRLNASAPEVAAGFAQRPAPDDVPAERNYIPGVNLLRPLWHLFGMLTHEGFYAVDIGFDGGPHLWAHLVVLFAADV